MIRRKDFGSEFSDQYEISQAVSLMTNTVGDSMTVQSQAEDADINTIMRKYGITGKLPENPRVPTYQDFDGIVDYRSALDAVRNADQAFMELPAEKRALFDNDPQKLLEFAHNPHFTDKLSEIFDGKRLQTVAGAARAAPGPAADGAQGDGAAAQGVSGDGSSAGSAGA